MRIITVSGAHRSVGKTTFARCLKARLPGRAEIIKIGHGPAKAKPERLFHSVEEALAYLAQAQAAGSLDYLIIESNRIAARLEPDLAVFLESRGGSDAANAPVDAHAGGEPASIARARKAAHIRVVGAGPLEAGRSSRETVVRPVEEQLNKLGSLGSNGRKAVVAALETFLESNRR